MKLMIASDIHGSAYYCRRLLECYKNENAGRLILLGDILYHGPRNDLPEQYAPKTVAASLNAMADSILCIRGNCEAEVDQMMLDFPCLADYAAIMLGDRIAYLTHGHVYNENNLPPIKKGDILLHGHTHVPKCAVHENYVCMNPGSVSIPKENSYHGYITYENGLFLFKDLDNNIKNEYRISE